jgi:imidazole glycerol-phosphate synthase subunit HisF
MTKLKPRIIARLDMKTENVVKSIRYEGLRIMGKPDELATLYYEQGADELLYIDTVASLYGRNNLVDIVKQAASHIFIPMTVGGGIRCVSDAQTLLRSGADKIAVNTAAVKTPSLISELANVLGSQAVVVSLQVKKNGLNDWEIYVDNGRERTNLNALDWAKQIEKLGAGEILITSVDLDGTGQGFEEEFISSVVENVSIPVIAAGGANTTLDIKNVISHTGTSAVAVASMLHYKRTTISDIKQELAEFGIETARH